MPERPKLGTKLGFFHFLKFGTLVFLEIVCNDNLQQCLTFSKDKFHTHKIGGTKFEPNRLKSGPKLGVFYFLKFGLLVFLYSCIGW